MEAKVIISKNPHNYMFLNGLAGSALRQYYNIWESVLIIDSSGDIAI